MRWYSEELSKLLKLAGKIKEVLSSLSYVG